MIKESLIKWLSSTDIPLSVVARETNISRNTLYSWLSGSDIRDSNLDKVYSIYGKEIENQTKETSSVNDTYLIELQKEKIENQEKEIGMLRNLVENNPVNDYAFKNVDYDYFTEAHLKYEGFKLYRKIVKHDGFADLDFLDDDIKEKYLQQSKLGEWHISHNHPVDELVRDDTKKSLTNWNNIFPTLVNTLKLFVGDHFLTLPVVYVINKKTIFTICSIQIKWFQDPHVALCKTKIMNIE